MRNSLSKLFPTFLCLGMALVFVCSSHSDPAATTPSRRFTFSYQVHVPPMKAVDGKLRLWLPLPQEDNYQKIGDLHIESPVTFKQGRDAIYGNPFVEFQPTAVQLETGFDATVRFVATRLEHKVDLTAISAVSAAYSPGKDPELQRYLEPDKMVPLNGVIADLAKEHTAGDTTELAKAHHIYEYVVSTMRYDKTGEGWGRGDAVWACTSKRGNCTDFHSLFIGMMRSSGIPARFEIGFPLPAGKGEGDVPGYHCWAEFYLRGTGWVPVDASEAWKNPSRHDYFFGAHDENRVFFSYGRDIRLSPDQKGDPLNYFIYPYAELAGKPVSGLQSHFSFKEVEPSNAVSAR